MKRFLAILVVWVIGICSPLLAFGEVVVIVHPDNGAALDAKSISKIFLGKSGSFPGGGQAIPVTLADGAPALEEFNSKVLKKSSSKLKSYWAKLVFTGKGTPPKEIGSEQEVVDLVKSNPAIIGFVSSGTAIDGVKSVGTF